MEYVPTNYKEPGGTARVTYDQPMLIVRNERPTAAEVDEDLATAERIFRDIFLRAGRELFLNGQLFSLDGQQTSPIIDSTYGVGAETVIRDIGDHLGKDIDATVWSDGYTGR